MTEPSADPRERGAALTEFVILTMVMVPLFFGIPMIGKLIDVRQTTLQASRYAAWEATVAPTVGSQPAHVVERFFGDPLAPITSGPSAPGVNPLWGLADGERRPEVVENSWLPGERQLPSAGALEHPGGWPAFSAIAIDPAGAAAMASEASSEVASEARKVGRTIASSGTLLGSSYGFAGDGMLDTRVQIDLPGNGWLGEGGSDCGAGFACLRESSLILVDTWAAANDGEAKDRIEQLVPAHKLKSVGRLVSTIGNLPVFKELKNLEDAFGHIDMGKLPAREFGNVVPSEEAELQYYPESAR